MDEARIALQNLEEKCESLNSEILRCNNDDERSKLRTRLKALQNSLEYQRKVYEDLEFKELEDESSMEEERVLLFRELVNQQSKLLNKFKDREGQLQKLEAERHANSHRTQQELDMLELKRQKILESMKSEKQRLLTADRKIRELQQYFHPSDYPAIPSLNGFMTSSGYCPKNKMSNSQHSPASLMTASLHEGIHGRFTDSNWTCPSPEDKCNIDYDNYDGMNPIADTEEDSGDEKDEFVLQALPVTNSQITTLSESKPYQPSNGNGHSTPPSDMINKLSLKSESDSGSSDLRTPNSNTLDVNYNKKQMREKKSRPLTKFLPSTDPEFDLRDHLLSLGHPLDLLSRQIDVNSAQCRGQLHKQGGKFKSWKKRWFVLDRFRKTLTYFTDSKEGKIKGFICFCDIMDIYLDHLQKAHKSPNKKLTFCIHTRQRTFFCVAPTPEVMRVWVDAIFTAAEGYLNDCQHTTHQQY